MEKLLSRRDMIHMPAAISASVLLQPHLQQTESIALGRFQNQTPDLDSDEMKKIILATKKMGGADTFGFRMSSQVIRDGLGFNIVYQRAVPRLRFDGTLEVRNICDEFSSLGLDNDLVINKYGVLIPPPVEDIHHGDEGKFLIQIFAERVVKLNISPKIANRVQGLKKYDGFDIGMPTSFEVDYGAFSLVRFQKQTLQWWKESNVIEAVLIGDIVFKSGMEPAEYILSTPTDDTDIQLPVPQKVETEKSDTSSGDDYPSSIDEIIAWGAELMGISVRYARAIVSCESQFNPRALGKLGERGLWQIHPIHKSRFYNHGYTWEQAFDPWINTEIAIEIEDESGIGNWSCA